MWWCVTATCYCITGCLAFFQWKSLLPIENTRGSGSLSQAEVPASGGLPAQVVQLFFTSFKRALHPLCFKLQTKKPGENLARAVHSREARRNHDKSQGTWGAEKCTVDKTFQQGPVNLSCWPPFLRATRQQRLVPQDDDLHLVSLSSPLVFYESCVTVVVFRVQFNLCLVCFADSFRHRISGFLQGVF